MHLGTTGTTVLRRVAQDARSPGLAPAVNDPLEDTLEALASESGTSFRYTIVKVDSPPLPGGTSEES